jgi:hypothetical protein
LRKKLRKDTPKSILFFQDTLYILPYFRNNMKMNKITRFLETNLCWRTVCITSFSFIISIFIINVILKLMALIIGGYFPSKYNYLIYILYFLIAYLILFNFHYIPKLIKGVQKKCHG